VSASVDGAASSVNGRALLREVGRRTGRSKLVVITGASDGIGAGAARALHALGHQVVVVGRSPEKTRALAHELGCDHLVADFTRLDDVRRLAADLDARYPQIDVLANNAGGVFGDPARTVDGHERTLQVNHLAPFLLTNLLMDKLTASRASVIQTTTLGGGNVRALDLDALDDVRHLRPIRAYNASKLANVLFTQELHRRFHERGVSSAVFYPGIVRTSFGSETTSPLLRVLTRSRVFRAVVGRPAEVGADQLVWLADGAAGQDWTSGCFYVKRSPAPRVNPLAHDRRLAQNLWRWSDHTTT
jgi:NAD(P)-dependent dehydrogenase (short-subunit alcohol dehydrogenase family)